MAVDGMSFTGEQVIPEEMGFDPRELQAHLARYVWALEFCQGKNVLDAACGVGYGTMILSWVAKKVWGMDLSWECIEYARQRYLTPRAAFVQSDVLKPLGLHYYDVVVSFETVEHLDLPGKFLHNVYEALKPGGILIVSAPENSGSKFHAQDYTREQLRVLLATVFNMETTRYFTQGPRMEIVEDEDPLWEHPTHIFIVKKGDES
jgi:2-polyprenyl-3-methyl-5-hydroxy-6-metoxy-1,4-benzoquinol methylase